MSGVNHFWMPDSRPLGLCLGWQRAAHRATVHNMTRFLTFGNSEVPTVKADDVKCLWKLWGSLNMRTPSSTAFGIDERVLAAACPDCADISAACARTMLLHLLFVQGLLTKWQDPEGIFLDVVFERMAAHPLPDGLERFDFNAFLESLRDS